MVRAVLRKRDGFPGSRAWLRSLVRNIQSGLVECGFEMEVDGRFGAGTQSALRQFQRQAGVPITGVADRATWSRLEPALLRAQEHRQPHLGTQLPTFRGDLDWVHDQEGHRGRPYWPGGVSGVTLDPGLDLGHAHPALIARLYEPLMSSVQYAAVTRVCGVKGKVAARALRSDPLLRSIRMTRESAESLLPFAAGDYWDKVCRRFPADRASTPAAVQTVLLSLAYNRGAGNRALAVLATPLEEERWAVVAELVGAMQQRHALPGIPRRRRAEASLIRAELEYLDDEAG